jgi:hypothetical protein
MQPCTSVRLFGRRNKCGKVQAGRGPPECQANSGGADVEKVLGISDGRKELFLPNERRFEEFQAKIAEIMRVLGTIPHPYFLASTGFLPDSNLNQTGRKH